MIKKSKSVNWCQLFAWKRWMFQKQMYEKWTKPYGTSKNFWKVVWRCEYKEKTRILDVNDSCLMFDVWFDLNVCFLFLRFLSKKSDIFLIRICISLLTIDKDKSFVKHHSHFQWYNYGWFGLFLFCLFFVVVLMGVVSVYKE